MDEVSSPVMAGRSLSLGLGSTENFAVDNSACSSLLEKAVSVPCDKTREYRDQYVPKI